LRSLVSPTKSLQQFKSLERRPIYRYLDNLLDFGPKLFPSCFVLLRLGEEFLRFWAAHHTHRCRRWRLESHRRQHRTAPNC